MTLFLVRHAKAGHRNIADPADLERSLDDYGRAQAAAIAELLAPHPITSVLTSSALRCQQTIAPLAARMGLEPHIHPALLEGSPTGHTLELIRSMTDQTAVLCSHGDIIPDVIRVIEVGGTRIHGQRRWAKGSIWQIDCDGEMLTDARYLEQAEIAIPESS